jgi:hypothetical protein
VWYLGLPGLNVVTDRTADSVPVARNKVLPAPSAIRSSRTRVSTSRFWKFGTEQLFEDSAYGARASGSLLAIAEHQRRHSHDLRSVPRIPADGIDPVEAKLMSLLCSRSIAADDITAVNNFRRERD